MLAERYRIMGLLGKGGMGEVWRARDTKLGREVAIKTLPAEFARDDERLSRFEREARVLAVSFDREVIDDGRIWPELELDAEAGLRGALPG